MLALIEPCIMDRFLDRPHLGSAMLIAACRERGIKTALIKGQTRYLRNVFIDDSEELWNFIQDIKEDDLKNLGIIDIARYKKDISEKGMRHFKDELKDLYQSLIIDKNLRHYFDGREMVRLNSIYAIFVGIYNYYLEELKHSSLNIVNRYVMEIMKSNPRYIGFSLQLSFDPLSRAIRKRLKQLTNIPIIIGGSLTPFINPSQWDGLFKKEYFDYLIIGPGEVTLPSLIKALGDKKEPRGIPNVFYKKNGRLITNELMAVEDLGILPFPDFSQFDLDLYIAPERILPLQTARGCSWKKCAFCNYYRNSFGTYRTIAIDKVGDSIAHLRDTYNCRHFIFHDDEVSPERAEELSKNILKEKLNNLTFCMYARFEHKYNSNKLLSLMHKAGFSLIFWGMESGCQRVLDLMEKGVNISDVGEILKKSSENKIANSCAIFFGFPGETREESQGTIGFLQKHARYIDLLQLQTFQLGSFSKVRINPDRWGVKIEGNSYSVKKGIAPEKAGLFCEEIEKKVNTNSIDIMSDKARHLATQYWHYRATLYALMLRHELLSKTDVIRYLEAGRLNHIFPIILGEIERDNNKIAFCPVNIKDTFFINTIHPVKERPLTDLEEKIFNLSDGTLSIEEIALVVYKDSKRNYNRQYVHKNCSDFFRFVFLRNWALAFARRWNTF